MKRLPTLIALVACAFLVLCFFQIRGRGMGFVPPLTEWELHPAWWHFDFLADCGYYLIELPAFYLVLSCGGAVELLGLSDDAAESIVAWLMFGLPIIIESLLVYCLARLLVWCLLLFPKLAKRFGNAAIA